jgi:hypothetical protein
VSLNPILNCSMAEHGLHASIWASKTSGNMHYGPRPGDWDCPACGFANYQRRTECFRCSYKGPKALSANGHELPATSSSHNAKILEDGGSWNEAGRASSGSTHLQKEDSTWNSSMLNGGEPGLAMSRWAPRNYDGRAKAADRREVWTRVRLIPHSMIDS